MYEVKKQYAERVVFVSGDTKAIKDCNASEVEILRKNYPGYFVKKTEDNSGGEVVETVEVEANNAGNLEEEIFDPNQIAGDQTTEDVGNEKSSKVRPKK